MFDVAKTVGEMIEISIRPMAQFMDAIMEWSLVEWWQTNMSDIWVD